jgi:hypothetical protein
MSAAARATGVARTTFRKLIGESMTIANGAGEADADADAHKKTPR